MRNENMTTPLGKVIVPKLRIDLPSIELMSYITGPTPRFPPRAGFSSPTFESRMGKPFPLAGQSFTTYEIITSGRLARGTEYWIGTFESEEDVTLNQQVPKGNISDPTKPFLTGEILRPPRTHWDTRSEYITKPIDAALRGDVTAFLRIVHEMNGVIHFFEADQDVKNRLYREYSSYGLQRP